jgi:predicted nicotinamide N-methyase
MARQTKSVDATSFIRTRMPLAPVDGLPGLLLHRATPQSAVSRLVGPIGPPPYWAYFWAGGLALAHHLRACPQLVTGRVVLDLGAGCGLVGLVAAQAGARRVIAVDTDPLARMAIALNAAANRIMIETSETDFLTNPAQLAATGAEVILVGDLFYDADLARQSLTALRQAQTDGLAVLIGDPGRADLPRDQLVELGQYPVRDMGNRPDAPLVEGCIFGLKQLG